jgi:hypothetical protein
LRTEIKKSFTPGLSTLIGLCFSAEAEVVVGLDTLLAIFNIYFIVIIGYYIIIALFVKICCKDTTFF